MLHTLDNLVIFVELLLHHSSGNLQKLTYSWNNQHSLFHVIYTFDGIVLLDLLLDWVGITQDFNVRLERLINHLCCEWWQMWQTPKKIKDLKQVRNLTAFNLWIFNPLRENNVSFLLTTSYSREKVVSID